MELETLGEKLKGKIVFFNRPMDPENIETFLAYRCCVDQRSSGAKEAARYGGTAIFDRSMEF